MLTRKEELFVKPFQQRLYHQHIVKVSIAKGSLNFNEPINHKRAQTSAADYATK